MLLCRMKEQVLSLADNDIHGVFFLAKYSYRTHMYIYVARKRSKKEKKKRP